MMADSALSVELPNLLYKNGGLIMIKKKIIILNIASLMVLGLIGCGKEKADVKDIADISQNTEIYSTTLEESKGEIIRVDYSLYDDVINVFKNGMAGGFNNDDINRLSISEDLVYLGATGSKSAKAGYIRKDIDNNNIEELIIGKATSDGNVVYNMYTINDGRLVTLLSGKERNSYYLENDGVIYNYSSSGAGYAQYNYYKINNSELKLIESVFQNKDRNPATPKQYYHSTIAAFDSNAMAVSDSEADNIKRKYLRLEYTFTYFNS